MEVKEEYTRVLANLLTDILVINFTDENYINKVLNVLTKYFQADCCLWRRGKVKENFFDFKDFNINNNLQRAKVMLLNGKNGDEIIFILNPRISYELEEFLIENLKAVLGNISKCEFSISDLRNEMLTDALTGVSNVDAFNKLLTSKSSFENIGVCFVDANGLGIINNLYGHEEGDKMLITIADVIKSNIRKSDIYRKGGDEFIIVCENIPRDKFFEKINAIKETLPNYGYSASFGATYSENVSDLNKLVKLADELMYIEKEKFRKENPDKYNISR